MGGRFAILRHDAGCDCHRVGPRKLSLLARNSGAAEIAERIFGSRMRVADFARSRDSAVGLEQTARTPDCYAAEVDHRGSARPAAERWRIQSFEICRRVEAQRRYTARIEE